MKINADFSRRVAVHADETDWVASPMPGVARKMLDRVGEEVARATSIVRYDPESHFSRHVHGGGEEFLVLDGVFQDEHGDYPAGAYLRNPPQSSHTPGAAAGCVILVKLWQFDPDDRLGVRTKEQDIAATTVAGRPHVRLQPLHHDAREDVRIETWAADATIDLAPNGGIEVFVLDGSFSESGETFRRWSWLRLPVGVPLRVVSGAAGARVWIKEGHLAAMPALP
ncbi:MAG: cupin domain-containing protein [Herminiimonas sp.]|nr:cupin domain-containing protein [Herminiimonas sp.]